MTTATYTSSVHLSRPALVVITPVRNEAWILEAFLTHCSSWADHIIIADQYSTDGSREIATRFPKVRLIDSPTAEWVEYRCRARLLEEASKIEGDKIIFGLDADEFLSDGFEQTESWRHIIESVPNELFGFNWFNLYGDLRHGKEIPCRYEWAGHYAQDVDIVELYLQQNHNAVHCARIPRMKPAQTKWTYFDDIQFVHLGFLNKARLRNKYDFYSVVNIDKNPIKAHAISLYRTTQRVLNQTAPLLPQPVSVTARTKNGPIDCMTLLKPSDNE